MIDRGTSANFHKDKKIKIGYYDASVADLNGFKYGLAICYQCQEKKSLFTFNPNDDSDNEWICIDCLANGDYRFQHNTEYGFVDEDMPEELADSDAKEKVIAEAYMEMSKTPNYLTLQGEEWLCHCNDFMIYKGTWEAPDFTEQSPISNGRALFMQITKANQSHLWDECGLQENETESSWDDCLYHAFECKHCSEKRGYWEH